MNDIITLLKQHMEGRISPEDQRELDEWVKGTEERRVFFDQLNDDEKMIGWLQKMQSYDEQRIWQKIRKEESAAPVRSLRSRPWLRYAAAVLIVLAGVGSWYGLHRRINSPTTPSTALAAAQDIPAPVTNKAVLTLANGQQVVLDSAHTGMLATQGNVTIIKKANGQMAYEGQSVDAGALAYNMLMVPKGSQITSLVLTDGTKVWLNSASSLRYPVAFAQNDRTVEITGEAYFEVTKDARRPFRVNVRGHGEAAQIDVLGTSFNVNAYADEPSTKATLVEGKIRIGQNGQAGFVEPGQQAQVMEQNGTTTIAVVDKANVQQAVAWKEGIFSFEQADLSLVMRQLVRWYDVEVEFKGNVAGKKFGGEIPRNSSLSQVLEMLKISGIHFEISGKKVIVEP